jgi:acetyl-CoA decarbonylase/synthase complex subunit gamma
MALTGIQIFKLLPKTNCKECGVPTCLAFAMNLASGKAELDSLPLCFRRSPRTTGGSIGTADSTRGRGRVYAKRPPAVKRYMYRHEKTFFNPTALAAMVHRIFPKRTSAAKLKGWNALQFERVGLNLRPELVALKDANGDAAAFARWPNSSPKHRNST